MGTGWSPTAVAGRPTTIAFGASRCQREPIACSRSEATASLETRAGPTARGSGPPAWATGTTRSREATRFSAASASATIDSSSTSPATSWSCATGSGLTGTGDALIVLDRVRSNHRHRYSRYFQLGPDIEAQRGSGGVALSAPGLEGEIYDAPTHGRRERPSLVRGRRSPPLGFTFPGYRQAVPRWTARYREGVRL